MADKFIPVPAGLSALDDPGAIALQMLKGYTYPENVINHILKKVREAAELY